MLSPAHDLPLASDDSRARLFIPSLPTLDPTLLAPSLEPARRALYPLDRLDTPDAQLFYLARAGVHHTIKHWLDGRDGVVLMQPVESQARRDEAAEHVSERVDPVVLPRVGKPRLGIGVVARVHVVGHAGPVARLAGLPLDHQRDEQATDAVALEFDGDRETGPGGREGFDRDIDAQMARTASRPVPSGRVSPRAALTYGCTPAVASFVLMGFVNSTLVAWRHSLALARGRQTTPLHPLLSPTLYPHASRARPPPRVPPRARAPPGATWSGCGSTSTPRSCTRTITPAGTAPVTTTTPACGARRLLLKIHINQLR